MSKYEFVSKSEYAPKRVELESIIKKAQTITRKKYGYSFQFKLVGSGGRHLITRVKNGNQGYDFDYNLILNNNYYWEPETREEIFEAIREAIGGTRYNAIENSTSVITIKQVDKKNKKVLVGCDFSVIYYPEGESGYMYARLNKKYMNYIWEKRGCSEGEDYKLEELKKLHIYSWDIIKCEYIKLKESDKQNKHSYILYHEAVNNVYNQLSEQKRYINQFRDKDGDIDLFGLILSMQ